ncbi:transcriptional regulator [Deferribacter desulfuricans SSM1]|uniref:Transcriptional regulator n=1 Tax=Deferribacter desulfuricans (strain DSM 14783 / JCM 11476 / NBRC 101012 / SSM1) TaxID=639282 RepID=D3PB13_DEFDS|nr:AlpA family phage regulatory protein [Deferribacter desulfuricans]BAI79786.1 transcriptional regulator [Deferribacter desulfuricans SSM1]
MVQEKLLRLKDVLEIIPVGRSTWYEGIKKGIFPKPIKLGRSSFWKLSDIQKLIEDTAYVAI